MQNSSIHIFCFPFYILCTWHPTY